MNAAGHDGSDPAADEPARPGTRHPAGRALLWFWAGFLVLVGAGAGTLQLLGPPAPRPLAREERPAAPLPPLARAVVMPAVDTRPAPPAATPAPAPPSSAPPSLAPPPPSPTVSAAGSAAAPGAPIAAPDPSLLEPAADAPDERVPRIGADGRRPMQVYAGSFDPADPRPRIAVVVDGLGLSDAYSRDAIEALPAPVTLAFSPYAPDPERLLEAARAHGHEILASVPLEPAGYPLNDPGPQALLTGRDPALNGRNLLWALSRTPGAVGATGAMDGLRGERYAEDGGSFGALQDELDRRGLLYLDPRPGSPSPSRVPGRGVDLVLDEPASRQAIDAKLAELEQLAHDRGAAVGLAGPLRPVTVERLAAWSSGLGARGFVLVPVSALARAGTPAPAPLPASAPLPAAADATR